MARRGRLMKTSWTTSSAALSSWRTLRATASACGRWRRYSSATLLRPRSAASLRRSASRSPRDRRRGRSASRHRVRTPRGARRDRRSRRRRTADGHRSARSGGVRLAMRPFGAASREGGSCLGHGHPHVRHLVKSMKAGRARLRRFTERCPRSRAPPDGPQWRLGPIGRMDAACKWCSWAGRSIPARRPSALPPRRQRDREKQRIGQARRIPTARRPGRCRRALGRRRAARSRSPSGRRADRPPVSPGAARADATHWPRRAR